MQALLPPLLFVVALVAALAMINGQAIAKGSSTPFNVGWWTLAVVGLLVGLHWQAGASAFAKQWAIPSWYTLLQSYQWGIMVGVLLGGMLHSYDRTVHRQPRQRNPKQN